MNSFGLNSAALNAGVNASVLGAALLAAVGTLTAAPLRTALLPDPVVISSGAQLDALGVRMCLGAAKTAAATALSADGVIAITSSAESRATSKMTARYTDVYATIGSSFAVDGTRVLIGAAASAGTSAMTAEGQRTAYFFTYLPAASAGSADGSVKRSGQATTDRDGYVAPINATTGFSANGLRTANGLADMGIAGSFIPADALKTHGGRARLGVSSNLDALASTDGAFSRWGSNFTATPLHTHNAGAQLVARTTLDVPPIATTQAFITRVTTVIDFFADGRLALRGAASPASMSRFTSAERLAQLGSASAVTQNDLLAAPWVYRPAFADIPASGWLTASGTRAASGQAVLAVTVGFTADPIANPGTLAPASRSVRVPADPRSMRIPYENRTMRAT